MKIFSFFGSSGSGKTTIIENIILSLSNEMKIGYIKSLPHNNISLDTQYKDTWKMEKAGSYKIYGLSPSRTYMMVHAGTDPDTIIKNDNDVDMYIIEGFNGYQKSVRFLVLGDEEYLNSDYEYIIKANNSTYSGRCIKYPEQFNEILDILRAP
jgi:molybdopterin-guanine dinucleotide biosynthesis protein B